ncbi:MAG: DinB family protein [Candidatus Hodarchaeota archaeon]
MTDLKNTLINCFRGTSAHVDSLKALKELSAAEARKRPAPAIHSIWENVYHMIFWHNVVFDSIRGKKIDLKSTQGKDWPTSEELEDDSKWSDLVASFKQTMDEAKEIVESEDLSKKVSIWGEFSVEEYIRVIAQHNSYHIGQIVVLRQLMGKWPPPE